MKSRLGRGQRHRKDSIEGLSIVAACRTKRQRKQQDRTEQNNNDNGGCLLLLGSLSNALAVASSESPIHMLGGGNNKASVHISHIVSVADRGKAREVERALLQAQSNSISFLSFFMADRLAPETIVDIQQVTKKPIQAIQKAMGCAISDGTTHTTCICSPPTMCTDSASTSETAPRGILIHCNQGHNRSPTLVLAFLISCCSLSLRQAYQILFRCRPGVDPLPNYRSALVVMEQELRGSITVEPSEVFHLHMSQLLKMTRERQQQMGIDNKNNDSNDGNENNDSVVRAAYKLRQSSIQQLLSE